MTIRHAEDDSGADLAQPEAIAWKFVCERPLQRGIFFIQFRASRFAKPSGSPVFAKPFPSVAPTDGDGATGVLRPLARRDLHCPFFGGPAVRRSASLRDKFARERKLRNDASQPQIQCIRILPRCGLQCTGFSANAHPFRFDTLKLRLITGAFSDGKQNDIQCAAHL